MPSLQIVPRRRADDKVVYAGPARLRFDRLSGGERVVRVVTDPCQLEFAFVANLPTVLPWEARRPYERETPWFMRMFNDHDRHPLKTERRQAFITFLDGDMRREAIAKSISKQWSRVLAPEYREVRAKWLASAEHKRQVLLLREAFFDRIGFFPRVVASPPPPPIDQPEEAGTRIAPWVVPPPNPRRPTRWAPVERRPPPAPLYHRDLMDFIEAWARRTGEEPPAEAVPFDWAAHLEDELGQYYDGAVPDPR